VPPSIPARFIGFSDVWNVYSAYKWRFSEPRHRQEDFLIRSVNSLPSPAFPLPSSKQSQRTHVVLTTFLPRVKSTGSDLFFLRHCVFFFFSPPPWESPPLASVFFIFRPYLDEDRVIARSLDDDGFLFSMIFSIASAAPFLTRSLRRPC